MKLMSWIAGGLIACAGGVVALPEVASAKLVREQPDPAQLRAERWYQAGVRALKDTRYKEALALFERALPFKAGHANLLYNLVQAALNTKQWDKVVLYGQGFIFRERGSQASFEVQQSIDRAFAALASLGRTPVVYRFDMQPIATEVRINDVPVSNALVNEVRLLPGKYTLTAPRDGYEAFTQTLTVEPKGEVQTVQGSLVPIIFKGKVAIATEPTEGVQVYLDDVPVGVTPIKDIELDTGKRYLFRFEKEGYDRWVRYIEVYRDEVVELKPVMERTGPVGRTVVSKPPSAALRLP